MDINLSLNEKISLIKNAMILSKAVETCNYTKAAEKLGMKQPNVSAAVRELETIFNIKLFTASAHGVIPTEAAYKLNKEAMVLEAFIHNIRNYSLDAHKYSGVIRLWMTDGLGFFSISKHFTDFCSNFPDVKLEINCSNETPDIAGREADIAIVYKEPESRNSVVISKHVVKFGLFASSHYINIHGKPKTLDELEERHYICDRKEYNTEWPDWNEILKKSKNVIALSNSTNILIQLNRLGLGIGLHPINSAKEEKDIIQVLPDFVLEHPYWLISHIDTKDTPKIRGMLEYLRVVIDKL